MLEILVVLCVGLMQLRRGIVSINCHSFFFSTGRSCCLYRGFEKTLYNNERGISFRICCKSHLFDLICL